MVIKFPRKVINIQRLTNRVFDFVGYVQVFNELMLTCQKMSNTNFKSHFRIKKKRFRLHMHNISNSYFKREHLTSYDNRDRLQTRGVAKDTNAQRSNRQPAHSFQSV